MTAAATAAAGTQNANDDSTDTDAVDQNAAADQGDDTADDKDGDESEVDWEAKAKELEGKVAAQQRINRDLERRTKRDKATIDKLQGAKPSADAKPADAKNDEAADSVDVDKIRAEAREQAKQEALQEALKERVLDKIELKAAKQFADPEDAVAMLLRTSPIEDFIDDNKIDVVAIQDALTELLEKKPYLGVAAQGGQNRFQGSAEGGAKPQKPSRPKSLDEAVRRRLTPQ